MMRWCELTGVPSRERKSTSSTESYGAAAEQHRSWDGRSQRGSVQSVSSGEYAGHSSDLQYLDQSASQSDLDLMRMYVLDDSLGIGRS